MRLLTVAIALLTIACVAQADILIDFGVDPNADPAGFITPASGWNAAWKNANISNLIDDTNTPTGINLAVSTITTDGQGGVDANNLYPYEAQKDYVGTSFSAPQSFVLTGLTEPEYTIVLFGSRAASTILWQNPGRILKASVDGGATTKQQSQTDNTTEKMHFYNVAPVGGTITIDWIAGYILKPDTGAQWGYGYVNVMEIIVPEPATLALLGLGGLVAIRRRRR